MNYCQLCRVNGRMIPADSLWESRGTFEDGEVVDTGDIPVCWRHRQELVQAINEEHEERGVSGRVI